RASADEELRRDVRIRGAVPRQPRDAQLLRRQLVARLRRPPPRVLAGRRQLAVRPLREAPSARLREPLVRRPQLLPGSRPLTPPPQPLAVQQLRTRQVPAG